MKKRPQECCYKCERRHYLCWSDCDDYKKRKDDDEKRNASMRKTEAELYSIAQTCKNKDKRARRK